MTTTSQRTAITVSRGDGIGPEIMDATLRVLEAAEVQLDIEEIEIGEKVFERGISSGIESSAWDSLRRTKVFLKAPITTPQGKGYKSLNVTTRKRLGLFANVRPCRSFAPYVPTKHPEMNVVIVRENEEDTYAGIEHRQTREVFQCLKLISRPGCERIVRYAFEYARAYGRKRVSCFSKDNIMKMTDGEFHRAFDAIGANYSDIEQDHWIIDIGTARLAARPEDFDVIVTANLYGDIISDVAAEISGSVGMCGSANLGEHCAMFEAIHGSAPDIAGQDIANPSGLLHGAEMMLVHIGQGDAAATIRNAWLKTIEDGIHTGDIHGEKSSKKVGTQEFADAVIERLGQMPAHLEPVSYGNRAPEAKSAPLTKRESEKRTIGMDVFLDWDESGRDPNVLGEKLVGLAGDHVKLSMISNRGVSVWPDPIPETFCTDHWRCRFVSPEQKSVPHAELVALLGRVHEAGLEFIKTETLCMFDGERAYQLGQGE